MEGHVEVSRLLLENRCNKDITDRDGKTALHLAAEFGRLQTTRCLVEEGGISPFVKTHEVRMIVKMICYQTSVGPVSDFIARWLRETDQVNNNWDNLKTQLNFRYGHIPDASYAFELLNKVNQKIGENVPIFGERILTLATDAFRGQDINQPIVQLQLVNFFINGLYQDYLRMKIMRENPQTLAQAVNSAMAETQLRRKFDLKKNNGNERNITPMDISHYREIGVKCNNCNRFGHKAKYCQDKN
ncbi:Hypothetical predicted protein [Mytilus galloprovincialis]|uniref:CCHC-type domain-containing protein n=1 Tax=Mytilus galloprovincialis TaxID=29158 RepID=A0A8B6DLD9_MYTGA|nr:Hypothetical predicted protein [Mytilus galloprovincialis]